ncbi:hypothetical protein [Metasolibacillus meyeri]|uniref:hypothetical protein n=1 Tax=Metasolibacillus meyeri TaxID=1071052 RepID=UPI000D307D23|nr:hypothetical protein [Metasolibacillus meyeri]
MTEKVKVSREIAEAMNSALKEYTKEVIVDTVIKKGFTGIREPLNRLGAFNISKMLVRGYEVDKITDEKEAKEYLSKIYNHNLIHDRTDTNIAFADGIEFAINLLGIKIKGIND